ncbi:MAG: zf-HC2 domain-containing protein [Aphanocapsa sp. GSE-SYN-MK-11-07L]|jgi:anti-sigma factor RsiW|nr:zf-HC2 domain-containing protein [Aphanocapsa sp. GSE-SYN-MK-11-07L]
MSFPYDKNSPNSEAAGQTPQDDLDVLKRDRFELLSAYLDGEVTADERRQVDAWLASDRETQILHSRLLKLKRGFQSGPVPTTQPTERTVEQVLARVERRPRLMLVWSGVGAAVAATVVGVVSSLSTGPISPMNPSTAKVQPFPQPGLQLTLDQPPVPIPAVSPVKGTSGNK